MISTFTPSNHCVTMATGGDENIEYAVNDIMVEEATVQKNVEALIQKCLAMPNIVMIYTTTYELNACATWHEEVAKYCGILSVDLQEYVKKNIVDELFSGDWKTDNGYKEYMEDGVHPTDTLYEIYANQIIEHIKANGFTAPQNNAAAIDD